MTSTTAARRARRTAALLDLTELAYAQWFFGNVYEAVVKIPDRLSAESPESAPGTHGRSRSILGPGSPVRYYLPAPPVALAGTVGAVVNGLGNPRSQRWLTVSAGCGVAGAALTAYVVRKVNLRLFFGETPPPAERDALLRTWYRLNVLRAAAVGGAMAAIQCAKHASLKNT